MRQAVLIVLSLVMLGLGLKSRTKRTQEDLKVRITANAWSSSQIKMGRSDFNLQSLKPSRQIASVNSDLRLKTEYTLQAFGPCGIGSPVWKYQEAQKDLGHFSNQIAKEFNPAPPKQCRN